MSTDEPTPDSGSPPENDSMPADSAAEAEEPKKAGFGKQQVIGAIVTLIILVVVFAIVLPQFGDYDQAWAAIQNMDPAWLVLLGIATIVVIVVYVFPYQAALPGLKYRPAFVIRQTSFMISNVIPMGGAIGLGVQYGMLNGYGYGPAPATATIGITSVWNTFITLALPVVGLLALAIIGELTTEAALVTLFGVIAIVVGIVLFALILRSEETARRIGVWADRAVSWAAGLIRKEAEFHLDQGLVSFRDSIIGVVADRWGLITATNLLQQLAQFSVLFIAILGLQGGTGGEINLFEAFAAFAFGRLATFIPVPPGGLGTTDAIITGALTAFGMANSDALAAVLIWRALTYFPQVLIGVGTFLYWRREQTKKQTAAAA